MFDTVTISLTPSVGGSVTDAITFRAVVNPTTGTLISDATNAAVKANNLIGDPKTIPADVFMGAEGKTITDGIVDVTAFIPNGLGSAGPVDTVLPPGASLSFSIEPPASNTSLRMTFLLTAHLRNVNN